MQDRSGGEAAAPTDPNPPATRRVSVVFRLLAVALLGAATLVATSSLFETPRFIDRLTLDNPTRFDLDVDVRGDGDDGWMAVWTATRLGQTNAEQVFDVGDDWIFRFRAQGATTPEHRVTRQELQADGWRLEIPAGVANSLESQGAAPPP